MWNWLRDHGCSFDTRQNTYQALMGSRVELDLDLSQLQYSAPAKLRTCCRHGVGYGLGTTAGYAFQVIHKYLVPDGTNFTYWENGFVNVARPTQDVEAWIKLMGNKAYRNRVLIGGDSIAGFRKTFKELGGWSDELKKEALALTNERFTVQFAPDYEGCRAHILNKVTVTLMTDRTGD